MFGMIDINSSQNFLDFLNYESGKLIAGFNKDYKQKIRDIAVKVHESNGKVNLDTLFQEITNYNHTIITFIADKAIEEDKVNVIYEDADEEGIDNSDDVSDILYEFYYGTDPLQTVENLIFNAVSEFHIPVIIHYDSAFEFPVFLVRYSQENNNLVDLIRNVNVIIEAENPQMIMFEDLFNSGSYAYGAGRVILK